MIKFLQHLFKREIKDPADPQVIFRLKNELEYLLKKELDSWYPASVDKSCGGFFTDLNYKFEPAGPQQKTVIHQSRHLWTISRACRRYPSNTAFREYADHGYNFIADKLWNIETGGFYTEVDREGEPVRTDIPISAFDQAFAIYSMVAYHQISKKPEALKLAIDTFHWLETYMYDEVFKGYFSYIDQDRNVVERPGVGSVLDGNCFKGLNSILHLLEAYAEFYKIWPDPLLRSRLVELLDLIQDKMIQPKGYLHNYFDKNWTPVRINNRTKSQVKKFLYLDHISFGHDAETAVLICEATKVLKNRKCNKTFEVSKELLDHSLKYGLDRRNGGLFAAGYYLDNRKKPSVIDKSKIWWVQAEALYAFLFLSSIYPDDERNYFNQFIQQFSHIKRYYIDYENGGWFGNGLDRSSKERKNPKSNLWKATYHTYRALENCVALLDERLKALNCDNNL